VAAEAQRRTRRDTQAEETRREIVACARRLFATQGYTATKVAQIAELAGVSVQTIYNSVGSKAGIVRHLIYVVEEVADVHTLASRIPTTTDARELLRLTVAASRTINERCEDIVATIFSAAATEPDVRAARDESRHRHRAGVDRVAQRLATLDALTPDLGPQTAADVVAALTDPQVARTFVKDYGWSWDHWESWTTDSLATLVLHPSV
jgi:AcrR family transcriptional regulator